MTQTLKWEYKRVTIWGTEGAQADDEVSASLTRQYGAKGWELVSAFYQQGEGYVYYFKRQFSPSQPQER